MATNMAGQAVVQQDSQTQQVKKPSIWRKILGLALLGGGAGMAARNPREAMSAGAEAVRKEQDRGFSAKR